METWRHRHGDMEIWRKGDMDTWRHTDMETSDGKKKTEAKAIFLYQFTVCSSCKRKIVVYLFVKEETNKSFPFANGLNGHSHL